MFEMFKFGTAFHILTALPSLGRIGIKNFFDTVAKHRGTPKEKGTENTLKKWPRQRPRIGGLGNGRSK